MRASPAVFCGTRRIGESQRGRAAQAHVLTGAMRPQIPELDLGGFGCWLLHLDILLETPSASTAILHGLLGLSLTGGAGAPNGLGKSTGSIDSISGSSQRARGECVRPPPYFVARAQVARARVAEPPRRMC